MRFTRATLCISTLLILGGCGGDDPVEPPQPELAAIQVTCTPASVTAGESSQCTASATDQSGKPFTVPSSSYRWTSSVESVATVDAAGKVSTKSVASTTSLTISATATVGSSTQTGQATLTVSRQPGTDHSTNITADETWRASDNPHRVNANLEVLATLTLEAGVELRFAPGFGLTITTGALKATGTQAAPVRMVSGQSTPAKGDWQGLLFSGAGSTSELDYVTLSHCGKDSGERACIAVKSQAAPVLRNVTVQNSGAAGVAVADDGSAFGAGSTTLSVSGSASYAIRIGANQASTLPLGGTFTDNSPDAIELRGSVSRSQTWQKSGIPYVVNDLIKVEGASVPTLTLAAGTVFRFGSGQGLSVGEGAQGELVVSGTANERVILTADSATPQPGSWRGVHLYPRTSSNSRISSATIEYAGVGDSAATGNLNVYGNSGGGGARPVVENVIVRKSSGYGVYLLNDGGFGSGSTALTANDNGSYAISIEPNAAGTLPTGGSFTGNGHNAVELRCCIVATTQTWPNLAIPYVVNAEVLVGYETSPILTLEAGTEVRVGADHSFQVGTSDTPGALKAVGTSTAPIRFVADTTQTTRGYWRGLHFWKASGSQLDYVTVSQAGAAGSIGTGNVNVYQEIGAFLTNSTLSDSSGCGVTISDGTHSGSTTVTTSFIQASYNNTFSNNANGRQCVN
ncbi:Ig-like domain-containing protein [Hyalangium versicolor]|uniref:Ig-like domain-containing protein n=1 Tax=Hyalangium versicolor TaxID=2861190 RepID=UPI001CCC6568|nr:Ig-like domain-containing protein [Hyalangium versicolor]